MATPREQFLLEEAGATRELIRGSVAEARALERYCLAASAGVWSWLLTHAQTGIVRLGYWIPLAVVALARVRVSALHLDIRRAARYLREVEWLFADGVQPEGWENRLNPGGRWRLPVAAAIFWALLLAATVVLPLLVTSHVA